MDDYNFGVFKDGLKKPLEMFSKDKCSKLECYTKVNGMEYRVIIEKVPQKEDDRCIHCDYGRCFIYSEPDTDYSVLKCNSCNFEYDN